MHLLISYMSCCHDYTGYKSHISCLVGSVPLLAPIAGIGSEEIQQRGATKHNHLENFEDEI